MEELLQQGKVRAIGVSNFYPDRLVDFVIHNTVAPAVNQVETHPFNQQIESSQIMKENSVQIESWGPFAEGKNNLFANETLVAIAKAHSKSVAQVVLRWLVQTNVVVIPKSVRKERMAENLNVFDFSLSDSDMAAIAGLDTGKSLFFSHTDPEMVKQLSGNKIHE